MGGDLDLAFAKCSFDATHSDILPGGHLEAHEVLEDDANLAVEVGQVVVAQVDTVEQDLAFGRIVEAGDELDDCGFALAVFADQGDAFAGSKREIEVGQDVALGPRVLERDVPELEAFLDDLRRREGRPAST